MHACDNPGLVCLAFRVHFLSCFSVLLFVCMLLPKMQWASSFDQCALKPNPIQRFLITHFICHAFISFHAYDRRKTTPNQPSNREHYFNCSYSLVIPHWLQPLLFVGHSLHFLEISVLSQFPIYSKKIVAFQFII